MDNMNHWYENFKNNIDEDYNDDLMEKNILCECTCRWVFNKIFI